jgi:hypothetical protein
LFLNPREVAIAFKAGPGRGSESQPHDCGAQEGNASAKLSPLTATLQNRRECVEWPGRGAKLLWVVVVRLRFGLCVLYLKNKSMLAC